MKKLFTVVSLTLALNFLAAAGAVGVLFKTGRLDRERVAAIKEIVFPNVIDAPTTRPADEEPTTRPIGRLDELLTKASGRQASEQVEFIQHAFEEQTAVADRRQRELYDLQRQVELAKQQMTRDRETLAAQKKELDARDQAATKLANDKGFQDSLTLYNSMPPKQVKTVFMGLDDPTVMNYLQAMEPRAAGKIIKEFKTPEEIDRVQRILERMRLAQASVKE